MPGVILLGLLRAKRSLLLAGRFVIPLVAGILETASRFVLGRLVGPRFIPVDPASLGLRLDIPVIAGWLGVGSTTILRFA